MAAHLQHWANRVLEFTKELLVVIGRQLLKHCVHLLRIVLLCTRNLLRLSEELMTMAFSPYPVGWTGQVDVYL